MRENDLGLELFYAQGVPGIGGKLRKTPEDFVVDEISMRPPAFDDGKFVIARVWHRNWELNRLVRRFGTNLRIGRARIGFAGTKDGRSVATQLMSFNVSIDDVNALEIPDVRILEAYTARRGMEIGDLIGNSFHIRVCDTNPGADVRAICESVKERLDGLGGFPNFFGTQRFGSVRPITHLIGKDLIRGDFKGAVMRYVANPMDGENSGANDARRRLQETEDFEQAIKEYPSQLTFERIMISRLIDKPGDYLGALRSLPANLLMMFVHAYQSYLFNKILSERVRRGISIKLPIEGDLILPLDKNKLPDHDNPILVTKDMLEKAVRNASEGKAFVSGLLYGTDSVFPKGEMEDIERSVIQTESIEKLDFQITGLREASSKGTRRELLAPYKSLQIDAGDEEAVFSFSLNKGCYATALLREFMKADASCY